MSRFRFQKTFKFIGRRLLFLFPQLIGVTIVVFLLVRLIPGNPAYILLGQGASEEAVAALSERMGLNKPMYLQYFYFIRDLVTGNMGNSWFTSNPVLLDISQRLPATLELVTISMFFIIVFSLYIAKVTVIRGNKVINKILRGYGFLGGAFPDFWLSLVIVYLLYALAKVIPAPIGRLDIKFLPPAHITGFYTIDALLQGEWELFGNACAHLVAPVLALVIVNAAPILKMAQATMLRVQKDEYVKYAQDNGLDSKYVESMIFRNSLPPVLTLIGYIYIFMLGGSVLVENIFSWGGLGQYAVQSITHSDYTPMQMIVLVSAIISFLVYLILDIIYYSIDPRIEI
ncbi:MAG: ABC transporter permease [Christensenellales bacterium]|jgi:ABC-type dipeptide/oligopeptide/nickel transport system permease component